LTNVVDDVEKVSKRDIVRGDGDVASDGGNGLRFDDSNDDV